MSSDRGNSKAVKPSLASNRAARSPLTPRLAGSPTVASSAKPTAPRTPASATPIISPRIRAQETSWSKDGTAGGNVTPRSAARNLRAESPQTSLGCDGIGNGTRPNGIVGSSSAVSLPTKTRPSRPVSVVGDGTSSRMLLAPLVRSPGAVDFSPSPQDDSLDGRFFHASDAQKQDINPKKPEPKRTPAFFYADGKEDTSAAPPKASSPVLSAVSDKRSSAPWMRPDMQPPHPSKSPPMLSPPLSALSGNSPFFPTAVLPQRQFRSPSPSKENIHLSYRKGASQIFGTRPVPRSSASSGIEDSAALQSGEAQGSNPSRPHRKSTSLSSIDSGNSPRSRGRAASTANLNPPHSAARIEKKPTTPSAADSSLNVLPNIDTHAAVSFEKPSTHETVMSPARSVAELAAEARRERKVLDLEISNSSLLAINASLEREIRKQKAELKRFRRLSRAGRISSLPSVGPAEVLSVVGEEEAEDDEYGGFGPPSGLSELYDMTDSEDDSSLGGESESMSPGAKASREQDRLAKDEQRLRVDLEKHRELLVQSQMMNQSLKRCMYATEEMISEGRKALNYNVRVSDVKLGGRILSGHEEDDDDDDDDDEVPEIEVEDDAVAGDEDGMTSAKGLLDVWSGVGRSHFGGSEASGDRDSGIEVDKLISYHSVGRPPPTHGPPDIATRDTVPSAVAGSRPSEHPETLSTIASDAR